MWERPLFHAHLLCFCLFGSTSMSMVLILSFMTSCRSVNNERHQNNMTFSEFLISRSPLLCGIQTLLSDIVFCPYLTIILDSYICFNAVLLLIVIEQIKLDFLTQINWRNFVASDAYKWNFLLNFEMINLQEYSAFQKNAKRIYNRGDWVFLWLVVG